MPITPSPLRPAVLQLRGGGPFLTSRVKGVLGIEDQEGELPVRLSLILEDDRQLHLPMNPEAMRKLWAFLDPMFRAKDGA